jgi:RHS repeat-associated protein
MTYTPCDSSWLITNAAGDEVAFYGYDAFGNLAFGTPASPFGYAGEYTDLSTGLSDLRARWYAPQTGDFTTRDPAFASTDTAYTYAGDDPVNETDPMGRYVVYKKLATDWVNGFYAALNWVSTGKKSNVQPGTVRVQFQISAVSVVAKAEVWDIDANIYDGTSIDFKPGHDSADIPFQFTAHPTTLAWPGDFIEANGHADVLTVPDFWDSYRIIWNAHVLAPNPNSPGGPFKATLTVETNGSIPSNEVSCSPGREGREV